jgi:hypothetical protein
LWDEIGRFYEPLFVPRSKAGFALEPEEERHLFEVASKNSRWLVAYLASVLARNTCLGTSEVRNLQLKNVDIADCRWVRLEGRVKNDFRIRTLECNADARWALRGLLERARWAPILPGPAIPFTKRGTRYARKRQRSTRVWQKLASMNGDTQPIPGSSRTLMFPITKSNTSWGHEINSRTKRLYDHVRDVAVRATANALSSGHVEQVSEAKFVEPTILDIYAPSCATGRKR